MSKISVIIPTYNEKETIIKIISQIISFKNIHLIVVDDSSPDNTGLMIKKRFFSNKKLTLITRQRKEGRGSAVIRGFTEGLKNKSTEFFIEMDADFSHNPTDIQRLIAACQKAEVVIASKYLPGSRIVGLSWKRRIFSLLANMFLRVSLGVPITDYTNGFRCYRRNVIESVSRKNIGARGFIALSEIIYAIYKKGFIITEIPTTCKIYKQRSSNFNASEIFQALSTVVRLKMGS